jgi:hypothetical protein
MGLKLLTSDEFRETSSNAMDAIDLPLDADDD